jgi:hypothetical protein
MSEEYVVEFQMTDELAARIARLVVTDRRFFLQHGVFFATPLLVLAVLLVAPLAILWTKISTSMFVAVLLAIGLGFWGLLWLLMYRHVSFGMRLYVFADPRRLVKITFTERDMITEASGLASPRKWDEISEIQHFGDFWLFRLKPTGMFAVPVAALSPELQEMIRRKAAEAGIVMVE